MKESRRTIPWGSLGVYRVSPLTTQCIAVRAVRAFSQLDGVSRRYERTARQLDVAEGNEKWKEEDESHLCAGALPRCCAFQRCVPRTLCLPDIK